MPPSSQSSFIPKKSIKRIERVRSSHRINILTYVAYSVFFGVILVSVATFFYLRFLESNLQQTLVELDSQRAAFSGGNIEAVKEMERRLRMAEYFFDQHTSAYKIFNELEALAVNEVIFSGFSFDRVTNDAMEVTITGQSFKFDSVAFQKDLFTDSDLFADAQFIEVTKEAQVELEDNNEDNDASALPVGFTAKLVFNTADLAYDSSVYDVAPLPAPVPVAIPVSTTTDATQEAVDTGSSGTTN
jgi:hypothetical protein